MTLNEINAMLKLFITDIALRLVETQTQSKTHIKHIILISEKNHAKYKETSPSRRCT